MKRVNIVLLFLIVTAFQSSLVCGRSFTCAFNKQNPNPLASTPANWLAHGGSLSYSSVVNPQPGGGFQFVKSATAVMTSASITALCRVTNALKSITPIGWLDLENELRAATGSFNPNSRHRCHIIGAQLGGANKDPNNFFTCHAKPNSPAMKHFEDMILDIVFTSNPHYRALITPAPPFDGVALVVETIRDPLSAYPDRIRMLAHQQVGSYFRIVYDVTIENKPEFTGGITHNCIPWFGKTGPTQFLTRNTAANPLITLPANVTANYCSETSPPGMTNFWKMGV